MANACDAVLQRAIKGAVYGSMNGAVGSFFAPVSAAAVGGASSAIATCAFTGSFFAVAASPLVKMTFQEAYDATHDPDESTTRIAALYALTASEVGLGVYLGCELAAAAIGSNALPIFTCYLTGAIALPVISVSVLALGIDFARIVRQVGVLREQLPFLMVDTDSHYRAILSF
ncbi:MAG: hypothetical protein P1U39_06210 [Legionellaceae bacterium]|jgi:hypothetical protein|nr:hypothetical protein [Legionellaceae bacterium]